MISPARAAAYRSLLAITSDERDLPTALAEERARTRDERDRSLAAAIVHGTLRWQRACDHLIAHFSRRPIGAIEVEVLVVLRLSVFQILHLDRVPVSAVVDDAVDLVRAARRKGATGFVNAVLRAMLRESHRLPWPARPSDLWDRDAALAYLGIRWSHPDWLVARWLDRYGLSHAERWVQFNNGAAPLTLAPNRLQTTRDELRAALEAEGVVTEPTTLAPDGLRVVSGNPLHRPAMGRFLVQDEASQLVPLAVDCQPGDRVLDLCASPGGKAVAMVGQMRDEGILVACDVRARRMRLLHDTIRQSGSRHAHPVQVPTEGALPFRPEFDRVLVDAPCSGLGTLRRDPDIKWRRQEAELIGLADRQCTLLHRAAATVRPGGRLVYATCSSEPEENEQVVDRFLASQPEFRPIDLRHVRSELAPVVDGSGLLRTLPFTHGLEAFFAAALVRRLEP